MYKRDDTMLNGVEKIKQKVYGKTKDGIYYKVKDLKFVPVNQTLYGTIDAVLPVNFHIDLSITSNKKYVFEGHHNTLNELALKDFYENHVIVFKLSKIHKDKNLVNKIIIKILK